jgi:hypothetical protein
MLRGQTSKHAVPSTPTSFGALYRTTGKLRTNLCLRSIGNPAQHTSFKDCKDGCRCGHGADMELLAHSNQHSRCAGVRDLNLCVGYLKSHQISQTVGRHVTSNYQDPRTSVAAHRWMLYHGLFMDRSDMHQSRRAFRASATSLYHGGHILKLQNASWCGWDDSGP